MVSLPGWILPTNVPGALAPVLHLKDAAPWVLAGRLVLNNSTIMKPIADALSTNEDAAASFLVGAAGAVLKGTRFAGLKKALPILGLLQIAESARKEGFAGAVESSAWYLSGNLGGKRVIRTKLMSKATAAIVSLSKGRIKRTVARRAVSEATKVAAKALARIGARLGATATAKILATVLGRVGRFASKWFWPAAVVWGLYDLFNWIFGRRK